MGNNKGKIKKIIVIVIVVLFLLCSSPFFLEDLVDFTYDIRAPRSKYFETPKPQFLYEFSPRVKEFYWSSDGTHLVIKIIGNYPNPNFPDTTAYYNIETGEVFFQEDITSSDQTSPPEVIEHLKIDIETERGDTCAEKNRLFSVGGLEGEQYRLKYWENGELVDTFYFSSNQWPQKATLEVGYYTPRASIISSPSCNKVALILSGYTSMFGVGDEELWMLDIPSGIFERIVVGRGPIIINMDSAVQYVTPSWSPNEDQIVFGGGGFELEIYDFKEAKSKILAGPGDYLNFAKWSPSGKWIAAVHYESSKSDLYIISPDGSFYSIFLGSNHIEDFQWAPGKDKIAILNYGNCNDLSAPSGYSLWLWDLEEIDI